MQNPHNPLEDHLQLLPALHALLEERNVTRAAKRLGLTQSALSHKLRQLRELLDDPLLVRGGQGMVRTARADALMDPLQQSLRALHAALQPPRPFEPKTSQRTFRLSNSDAAEIMVIPEVLERLQAEAPRVNLHLAPAARSPWSDLEDGRLDAAVAPELEAPAGIKRRLLSNEGFVVLSRRDHPDLKDGLTLETYLKLSHVLVSPRGGPGLVDAVLGRTGQTRHVALRTPHFAGAPFVVTRTRYLWTAPTSMSRVQSVLPIDVHPCPLELPTVPIYVYWHERMHHDAGHRWLRRQMFEEAAHASDVAQP